MIKTRSLLSSAWADAIRTRSLSSGCVLSAGCGDGLGRNSACSERELMVRSPRSLGDLFIQRNPSSLEEDIRRGWRSWEDWIQSSGIFFF